MTLINKAYAEETILVETVAPAGDAIEVDPSNPLMSLLPMVLIFVVFYFLLIRPQMKKQREQETMVKSLKKGDNIIAAGGIFGKIVDMDEKTIMLQVAGDVNIKILRSAIIDRLDKKGEIASEKASDHEKKESGEKKLPLEKSLFKKNSAKDKTKQ